MPTAQTSLIEKFFDFLYENQEGYICIATSDAKMPKETFKQAFFKWPIQHAEMIQFVEASALRRNVWFGVNLLDRPERKKQFCLPTNLVWADLDECHPSKVEPTPSITIESSPNRFQAIWRLNEIHPPEIVENFSKRIAYKYHTYGADPSGWDLTQLLRIPFTTNFKYEEAPEVVVTEALDDKLGVELFQTLPETETDTDIDIAELPNLEELPTVEAILGKHTLALGRAGFFVTYEADLDMKDDWSRVMWKLINICLESNLTPEETFAVMLPAKCNKYARDGRPDSFLWRDIKKAGAAQNRLAGITSGLVLGTPSMPLTLPNIYDGRSNSETFIDEYRQWGTLATDAIPEYHEIAAAILLSAVLAENIKLGTSYGEVVPNLWALILGDSTLTRKTTAMRMAMDMLHELDDEAILATDGSAEGLLTGLSNRPGRVSIYFRDEVAGFFRSINKKDYLAGMPDLLTQLYDVPPTISRILRKETIRISKPVFIFFGGGIKDRVYQEVSEEYILSGFLPRFLVVTGDADVTRIRTTGPPTTAIERERKRIATLLADIKEQYSRRATMVIAGQTIDVPAKTDAFLTTEAWEHYGAIEMKMAQAASESPYSALALPTFERLSRSLLKLAVLLCAVREEPKANTIQVEKTDVIAASRFIQNWGKHTVDLVMNSGTSIVQRQIQRILGTIRKNPGVNRSRVMQWYHLSKREADEIFNTLEDRGEIRILRKGRGQQLWAEE